jgi:hypothetical protein
MRRKVEEEGCKLWEGRDGDGDGEPCAQHCWEWRWGKGICKLPRKEDGGVGTMGKGGGGMDNETRGGGGGTQNGGRGRGRMAMGNLVLRLVGVAVGEGDMFVASSHGKK